MPILADSFKVVTGTTELPEGCKTGIHLFGGDSAFNLTGEKYCCNDTLCVFRRFYRPQRGFGRGCRAVRSRFFCLFRSEKEERKNGVREIV